MQICFFPWIIKTKEGDAMGKLMNDIDRNKRYVEDFCMQVTRERNRGEMHFSFFPSSQLGNGIRSID